MKKLILLIVAAIFAVSLSIELSNAKDAFAHELLTQRCVGPNCPMSFPPEWGIYLGDEWIEGEVTCCSNFSMETWGHEHVPW